MFTEVFKMNCQTLKSLPLFGSRKTGSADNCLWGLKIFLEGIYIQEQVILGFQGLDHSVTCF